MEPTKHYYITNRCHIGKNRWNPSRYGAKPSQDGAENLRFGLVKFPVDKSAVKKFLEDNCGFGFGNGEKLAQFFYSQRKKASIKAFAESLPKDEIEFSISNQSRIRECIQRYSELNK